MYNPCPLLDNFLEFGRKREEKKEKQQFLMLLENKSHVREDEEEVATLGSALITPTKSEQGHNYNSTASAVRPQSKQEEDKLSGGSGQPKGFISQSEGGNYIEEQQQDEI